MKATVLEFRFRLWLSFAIIAIGFWSPWIESLGWHRHTKLWLWLGFEVGSLGISSTVGIEIVTVLAIVAAAIGFLLRLLGTAYLGTQTVFSAEMKAGQVLADGPYRHLRNPLYLGSFLTVVAISVLMPPSGAAVSLVLLAVFLLRLLLSEEAFLASRLGESYAMYLKAVPRIFPSLWPRVAGSGARPDLLRALTGELFPLGVLISFAAFSWQYNSDLLLRAILISFGVSLIARALLPPAWEGMQPRA